MSTSRRRPASLSLVLHVAPVVVDDRLPAVADAAEHVPAQIGVPALHGVVEAHVVQAEVHLGQRDALAGRDQAHRRGRRRACSANSSRLVPLRE